MGGVAVAEGARDEGVLGRLVFQASLGLGLPKEKPRLRRAPQAVPVSKAGDQRWD